MQKIRKKIKSENGALIVEASIVFPVMFFVIFFLIYVGNAYTQKCRIEEMVTRSVLEGAAHCADPMLSSIEAGVIPGFHDVNLQPYRYIFGGMGDTKAAVEQQIEDNLIHMDSGFFTQMQPKDVDVTVSFKNVFIYATFAADVDYKIKIPFRLLGMSDFMYMKFTSHTEVPVSDVPEFIRNVDLVEDYVERATGNSFSESLDNLVEKVTDWFQKK